MDTLIASLQRIVERRKNVSGQGSSATPSPRENLDWDAIRSALGYLSAMPSTSHFIKWLGVLVNTSVKDRLSRGNKRIDSSKSLKSRIRNTIRLIDNLDNQISHYTQLRQSLQISVANLKQRLRKADRVDQRLSSLLNYEMERTRPCFTPLMATMSSFGKDLATCELSNERLDTQALEAAYLSRLNEVEKNVSKIESILVDLDGASQMESACELEGPLYRAVFGLAHVKQLQYQLEAKEAYLRAKLTAIDTLQSEGTTPSLVSQDISRSWEEEILSFKNDSERQCASISKKYQHFAHLHLNYTKYTVSLSIRQAVLDHAKMIMVGIDEKLDKLSNRICVTEQVSLQLETHLQKYADLLKQISNLLGMIRSRFDSVKSSASHMKTCPWELPKVFDYNDPMVQKIFELEGASKTSLTSEDEIVSVLTSISNDCHDLPEQLKKSHESVQILQNLSFNALQKLVFRHASKGGLLCTVDRDAASIASNLQSAIRELQPLSVDAFRESSQLVRHLSLDE